ncbi:MAG TPA: hypothetical protein VNA20_12860 [Frankiaceae bacterium]|nr:hypothetical protein [Frankiaceae bacterium]
MDGEVWRLHHDGAVVAELHVTGRDQPWLLARVESRAGFDAVAPLFAEELRLLDRLDSDAEEWEAAYRRVRAATRLTDPAGDDVAEYLLHVDGDQAWWRRHHEPFGPG